MRSAMSVRKAVVLPAALVLAGASASAASGQGRELFTWSGSVDRVVEITMRGRNVWSEGVSSGYEDRGRSQVQSSLPREPGQVMVRVEDGRGEVRVVQQPTARNDYTTVVRISDARSGADRYRISAYWRPDDDRGQGRGNAGRGSGDWDRRDRRDDDRWDDRGNRRDDDRWDDRGNRGLSGSMAWSGRVDDVLEIRLRGDRISYRTLSGQPVRNVRADLPRRGLPREDVQLRLERVRGRGNVRIVQQPSARNGYTAIIHVRDPRGGYGDYSFDLSWRQTYARRW